MSNEQQDERVGLLTHQRRALRDALVRAWQDDYSVDSVVDGLVATVEDLLSQQRDEDLAMHHAYRPEVVAEVAVHLGSHEDWNHIANWCGGEIHHGSDPSGEGYSWITLPNGEQGGDWAWLVLNHAGEFHFRTEVEAPSLPPAEPLREQVTEALRQAFSGDEFEENAAAAAQEGEWSWFKWLAVSTIESLSNSPDTPTTQPTAQPGGEATGAL